MTDRVDKIVQIEYDPDNGSIVKLDLRVCGSALENTELLDTGLKTTENGTNSSYHVRGMIEVSGTMYIDTNPSQKSIKYFNRKPIMRYKTETYKDYVELINNLKPENTMWIEKILNGDREQEKILYRNDEYIVVRDWKFDIVDTDNYNIEDFHLLGIPNKNIKTMRDIRVEDIQLLDKIKCKCLEISEIVFGIDPSMIKMYFHYPPSVYHLHIHFTWICLKDSTVNFERAFDYDTVIKNIKLDPEYYKSDQRVVRE
jgi:diadenosine tetraphosphate (Ap4A) HIT family hydrolase